MKIFQMKHKKERGKWNEIPIVNKWYWNKWEIWIQLGMIYV